MKRMRAVYVATFGALMCLVAASATFAQARADVPELLRLYTEEHRIDRPDAYGATAAMSGILRNPGKYPGAVVNALVEGLESIVERSADPSARGSATWMLGLPGLRETPARRDDTFGRLVALYRRVPDPAVRAGLLAAISRQSQTAQSGAFLRAIASETPSSSNEAAIISDDAPIMMDVEMTPQVVALELLERMPSEACRAFRELRSTKAVREANARARLSELVRRCKDD